MVFREHRTIQAAFARQLLGHRSVRVERNLEQLELCRIGAAENPRAARGRVHIHELAQA